MGPAVARRVATAQVTASKAAFTAEGTPRGVEPADEAPPTARVPRVLGRRKPPVPAAPMPDGPVVVYELETEDDDDDAGWAPPAWVSMAARRLTSSNPDRGAGNGRTTRSTRTPT